MGEELLWCPNCGGHEYTSVAGGSVGLSHVEVSCDSCGTKYRFATNVGANLARAEHEQRERDTPDDRRG
jgi:RNase P subunit RPR2